MSSVIVRQYDHFRDVQCCRRQGLDITETLISTHGIAFLLGNGFSWRVDLGRIR
jgi:hypothetical protein